MPQIIRKKYYVIFVCMSGFLRQYNKFGQGPKQSARQYNASFFFKVKGGVA